MINKQKIWFLTLFSLILVLSVYYITMPSEILTTAKTTNSKEKNITANKKSAKVTSSDILTALQVESDEIRKNESEEYNETLTNDKSTDDEKNNAYEGLKKIDEIKSKEEKLKKLIKKELKLDSFIKIDGNNISVTLSEKDHNYSLANNIMRIIQKEFEDKKYISVKFQN